MNDNEHLYKGLSVTEPYKSYWTDFSVACYDNLGLGELSGFVDIVFVAELPKGIFGSTVGDDSEVLIEIAMFSNGTPIPFNEIQKTIAHELTHAKQYLTGRLIQCPLQTDINGELICKYLWCGKEYLNTKYKDRPWEHEANITEDVLVSGTMYDLRKIT